MPETMPFIERVLNTLPCSRQICTTFWSPLACWGRLVCRFLPRWRGAGGRADHDLAAFGRAMLLIENGTPELVREMVRVTLEILAPDSGFILGPGYALPANTPDENIDALIETARNYSG